MNANQKEVNNPYGDYVGRIGILQGKAIPSLLTRVSIHIKTGIGITVHGYLLEGEKPLTQGEAVKIVGLSGTGSVLFKSLNILK